MRLTRADHLTEPPVVGRWYLVPAILWDRRLISAANDQTYLLAARQRGPQAKWWPVWGNKHTDVEHFEFPWQHYHIDPRFLSKRQWLDFEIGYYYPERTPLENLQGAPLCDTGLKDGPPPPTLRRMRCSLAVVDWQHAEKAIVHKLNDAYRGRTCARGRRGFICPHKNFSLAAQPAVDGVITCPLHGLRIDAATGICLGSKTESTPVSEGELSPPASLSPDPNINCEAA